jgi:hypothetical protein
LKRAFVEIGEDAVSAYPLACISTGKLQEKDGDFRKGR